MANVLNENCRVHAKLLYTQCILHPDNCAYIIEQVMHNTDHAVTREEQVIARIKCRTLPERKSACANLMNQYFYPYCVLQDKKHKVVTDLLEALESTRNS